MGPFGPDSAAGIVRVLLEPGLLRPDRSRRGALLGDPARDAGVRGFRDPQAQLRQILREARAALLADRGSLFPPGAERVRRAAGPGALRAGRVPADVFPRPEDDGQRPGRGILRPGPGGDPVVVRRVPPQHHRHDAVVLLHGGAVRLRDVARGRGTAPRAPLAAPLLRGDGPGDPIQGAGRRGAAGRDRRPAPALRPALAGPAEDISPPGDRPLLRAHGAVVLGGLPRQPRLLRLLLRPGASAAVPDQCARPPPAVLVLRRTPRPIL